MINIWFTANIFTSRTLSCSVFATELGERRRSNWMFLLCKFPCLWESYMPTPPSRNYLGSCTYVLLFLTVQSYFQRIGRRAPQSFLLCGSTRDNILLKSESQFLWGSYSYTVCVHLYLDMSCLLRIRSSNWPCRKLEGSKMRIQNRLMSNTHFHWVRPKCCFPIHRCGKEQFRLWEREVSSSPGSP